MLIEHFGGNVASFFGNQNGLQVSIGGDDTGSYADSRCGSVFH